MRIAPILLSLMTAAAVDAQETAVVEPSAADWRIRERALGDLGALRPALAEHGIALEPWVMLDLSRNLDGGIDEGSELRGLAALDVSVDLDRAIDWPGAIAFAQFMVQEGDDAAAELVGDLQAFDNLDSPDRVQISEVWLEQRLLADRLRIVLGKIDGNALFAASEHGAAFLNSSMGFSPSILAFPSYPDPAFSLNVVLAPTDRVELKAAWYDGSVQAGVATGSRGPSSWLDDGENSFFIAEADLRWELDGLDGRAALGAWWHSGDFDDFAGGHEDGTSGGYLIIDHALWSEADAEDQGLAGFLQFGWADEDLTEMHRHLGLGLTWTGAIEGRDADVIGLGMSRVWLSDAAGFPESAETAYELLYSAPVFGWLLTTADLQYIVDPGGGGLDDALVLTLRGELAL